MKKFITIMVLALAAMLMVSCLGLNLASIESVEFETAPQTAYKIADFKNAVSNGLELKLLVKMTSDTTKRNVTAKISRTSTVDDITGEYNVIFNDNLTATANIAKKAGMENWYTLTILFDNFVSITHDFFAGENLNLYYFAGVEKDAENKEYFQITNAQQLSNIRYNLEANYILKNDIDISDMQWIPIGNGHRYAYDKAEAFKGIFDGNNKTINGLSNKNYAPDASFVGMNTIGQYDFSYGLFGCTDDATIKNVKFTNVDINLSKTFMVNGIEKPIYSGALGVVVGQAFNSITLDNVKIGNETDSSYLKGYDGIGGLIGRMYNEREESYVNISNCHTYIEMEIITDGSSRKIGGFIGHLSSAKYNNKQYAYKYENGVKLNNCSVNKQINAKITNGVTTCIAGLIVYSNIGTIQQNFAITNCIVKDGILPSNTIAGAKIGNPNYKV